MMVNLLAETLEDIKKNNYTESDIVFIGFEGSGECMTWQQFIVAADYSYDNGYGVAIVNAELIIGFADGAKMFRCEYDGSEWWELFRPFRMPQKLISNTKLKSLF